MPYGENEREKLTHAKIFGQGGASLGYVVRVDVGVDERRFKLFSTERRSDAAFRLNETGWEIFQKSELPPQLKKCCHRISRQGQRSSPLPTDSFEPSVTVNNFLLHGHAALDVQYGSTESILAGTSLLVITCSLKGRE